MVRYVLAAAALKAFSMNRFTRRLYRALGNRFGQRRRRRAGIDCYVERAKSLDELCVRRRAIRDGGRVLEIGTGWVHWYSLYLRVFHRVTMTMVDVWDNRQLAAMKALFADLKEHPAAGLDQDGEAAAIVDSISSVGSFEELYDLLDLEYVIDGSGTLRDLASESFDTVFSFHVLEHVREQDTDEMIANMHRVLRPGGCSIHQIGIDDHLAHYDRARESPKSYLQYSDRVWRTFFQNDVQYFNRLQMSDWLRAFRTHGFELVEHRAGSCNIDSLGIAPKYDGYSKEDLACTTLTIVCRKVA